MVVPVVRRGPVLGARWVISSPVRRSSGDPSWLAGGVLLLLEGREVAAWRPGSGVRRRGWMRAQRAAHAPFRRRVAGIWCWRSPLRLLRARRIRQGLATAVAGLVGQGTRGTWLGFLGNRRLGLFRCWASMTGPACQGVGWETLRWASRLQRLRGRWAQCRSPPSLGQEGSRGSPLCRGQPRQARWPAASLRLGPGPSRRRSRGRQPLYIGGCGCQKEP